MSEPNDPMERRLERAEFLKLAAATGGAGLLANLGAGAARASGVAAASLSAESGKLQVLDWAGYGFDGGTAMFSQYLKTYPKNKPQFTNMTNEADALAKLHAGIKPDIVRPYNGWVKYFADSGFVQPWDTTLIPNFKHLNPVMVKGGQYQGKQYGIPADWGFDSLLYRTDKVKPKAQSWGLMFDDRYKGRIAWYDDGVEMFIATGYYLGFKDPHNLTDAQLKQAQKLLISKKKNVRMIWASETDMDTAFASGEIWIAYAWPNDWVQMKAKKLPVVYMKPKEGALAWIGMLMLGKDTPRPKLAHAYADAWSSKQSGSWLEDNYGYGHANLLAKPKSNDLLKALKLNDPKAVAEPNSHPDRDVPRRALYNKLWEEVKAS